MPTSSTCWPRTARPRWPTRTTRWSAPGAASTCATPWSPPGASTAAGPPALQRRATGGRVRGVGRGPGLVQDVTLEREAEQASERVRQQVVETINHEFRTPLAALLGHVELVHEHQDRRDDSTLSGHLAGGDRAGRVAAARPARGRHRPGRRAPRPSPEQQRSREPARGPARPGRGRRTHSAGLGTERTAGSGWGSARPVRRNPASTAMAAGPPISASSTPATTGASGSVDQLRNCPVDCTLPPARAA